MTPGSFEPEVRNLQPVGSPPLCEAQTSETTYQVPPLCFRVEAAGAAGRRASVIDAGLGFDVLPEGVFDLAHLTHRVGRFDHLGVGVAAG